MTITHTISSPINVSTFPGYPLNSFCLPPSCEEDVESVIIPGGLLKNRIQRLAFDIANDYIDEPFILVCILRGAFTFFNTLLKEIKNVYRIIRPESQSHIKDHIGCEFVRIKSYKNDKSTEITMTGIEDMEIVRGKNVLVIEDIIDTGKSMKAFFDKLNVYEPKSTRLACLTYKTKENCLGFAPHYTGFIVPDRFIVGANFEYNDHYRNLEHVCIITDEAKQKYSL